MAHDLLSSNVTTTEQNAPHFPPSHQIELVPSCIETALSMNSSQNGYRPQTIFLQNLDKCYSACFVVNIPEPNSHDDDLHADQNNIGNIKLCQLSIFWKKKNAKPANTNKIHIIIEIPFLVRAPENSSIYPPPLTYQKNKKVFFIKIKFALKIMPFFIEISYFNFSLKIWFIIVN